MDKFILHGGYSSKSGKGNAEFFSEFTNELADGATILLVYFSREEAEYDSLRQQDESSISNSATGKAFKFIVADQQNFIHQVANSDAINIRGGNTDKLLEILKKYPHLSKEFKGKVVAGSSAGAYILSKYYYSVGKKDILKGLGILPIKVICHYSGDKSIIDNLKNHEEDLGEPIVLKDFEYKVYYK